MKHNVTSVYLQEKKNIVLVQLIQAIEICLHQYICKNYLERKDITIMIQKDLLAQCKYCYLSLSCSVTLKMKFLLPTTV